MHEGMRRVIVAIRVLSWLWLGGMVLYFTFGDERMPDSLGDRLMVAAFTLAPGYIGLGVAWILDGFARRDSQGKGGK